MGEGLRQLYSPLAPNLGMISLAVDRDALALRRLRRTAAQERLHWLNLHDLWRLVSYPVTEREHAAILARERAHSWPLEEFARFLVDVGAKEDWRPAVLAFLGQETD